MSENQQEHEGHIVRPRLIQEEMKQSYLDYSMSVIVGRALPDARDGLKPVHRRVLFAMKEMGLASNKAFKKCARVVGDCLGKYHPHGDTAVYDALVRLAQDFSLRYPLIKGQGNFGSVDGDRPAAMRYTECRLTKLAEEMLEDIDKETVEFTPNFDNSTKEPSILPGKIPNLLLNGSSGIAVGMATNIPPHNMNEVVDATVSLLENPDLDVHEIMQHIKGPDFPTGGIICGTAGIKHAYHKGRGKIIVRARIDVEEKQSKRSLIISEIPYMVNKSELLEDIAGLVRNKKIEGISDIRDESDKRGMRAVIDLKKDADASIIENQLYQHTRLQVTFGANLLSLVDNVPKVLNIKDLIGQFVGHRKSVVTKRTTFDLKKAKERAHILEGILVALKNIDEVIKLIRASRATEDARQGLMSSYELTEIQANAILDMRLQRLTNLEQDKVKIEHADLLKKIEELTAILNDPQKVVAIIKDELLLLKEKYGDERRTQISEDINLDVTDEDLIKQEDMVVTITHSGYIKRLPLDTYKIQNRGGRGVIGAATKEEDVVRDVFVANTHSYILFFTNKGNVYWRKVYKIPEASRQGRGKAIVNLIEIQKDEKVTTYVPITKFEADQYLVMATRKGTVKRTSLMAFSRPRRTGIIAITLQGDDELVNVELTDNTKHIMIGTANGSAIRFNEQDVRASGRSSQGVRGIYLRGDDSVVGMIATSPGESILTITENGFGKRTSVEDYRLISRGGSGVINIKTTPRNGRVAAICAVKPKDDVMFISESGIVIRVHAHDISEIGRNTQGVILMRLDSSDKVVSTTVTKE